VPFKLKNAQLQMRSHMLSNCQRVDNSVGILGSKRGVKLITKQLCVHISEYDTDTNLERFRGRLKSTVELYQEIHCSRKTSETEKVQD
jgi:hypothetical protein